MPSLAIYICVSGCACMYLWRPNGPVATSEDSQSIDRGFNLASGYYVCLLREKKSQLHVALADEGGRPSFTPLLQTSLTSPYPAASSSASMQICRPIEVGNLYALKQGKQPNYGET